MRNSILLLLIGLFFLSCSKEQTETVDLSATIKAAPLHAFIGTWDLDSRVEDGVPDESVGSSILFIEEDSINTDYYAKGYYEYNSKKDIIVIVEPEDSVITLKMDSHSIICDYAFSDSGDLKMTEEWEVNSVSFGTVTTWKKRD